MTDCCYSQPSISNQMLDSHIVAAASKILSQWHREVTHKVIVQSQKMWRKGCTIRESELFLLADCLLRHGLFIACLCLCEWVRKVHYLFVRHGGLMASKLWSYLMFLCLFYSHYLKVTEALNPKYEIQSRSNRPPYPSHVPHAMLRMKKKMFQWQRSQQVDGQT